MEKEKYTSVLHKKCGGQVLLVGNNKKIVLCCGHCKDIWEFRMPYLGLESIGIDKGKDFYFLGTKQEEKQDATD